MEGDAGKSKHYLPVLQAKKKRTLKRFQWLTCSIPPMWSLLFLESGGSTQTLNSFLFFTLYFLLLQWGSFIVSCIMANFLSILVPQFTHKMKQYRKRYEKQMH